MRQWIFNNSAKAASFYGGLGGMLLNNRVIITRHGSKERLREDHDVTVSIGD